MRTHLALLFIAVAACGEAAPPAVTVGPVSFTENQLLGLSPARRNTLAHIAAFALAVADSSTRELGAPLIARWQDDARLEILAADLTLEKNGVSDAVLEARYLTDPAYELTVRHILFFSERWRTAAERAEAKTKAERALEALQGGADFAETAARLSEEPGAEGRQGLLTPGREGAWVDEFWAAASALEVGEISPVTETQYGFHILRLEGRTIVPFAEARSSIARAVADRIEDPAAVLAAWQDGRAGSVVVNEGTVAAPDGLDAGAELATWEGGGRLTLEDYRAFEASELAAWRAGGLGTDPEQATASVRRVALRRMALDEAEARQITLSDAERAALARQWDDITYRWTAAMGLRYGAGPEAVGKAALVALAHAGQGTIIARDEVDSRAPLLSARYEMTVAAGGA